MRTFLLALFCLFIAALSATGSIAGKVVLEETGEGVANIAVVIEGSGVGAMTNRGGGYILKNIPDGDYILVVRYIGHKPVNQPVTVTGGETTIANLRLEVEPLAIEGIKVSANRAVRRETPVAFSTLNEEELSDRYTTQDVPQLMEDVPGLFASSLGLGESEITMRGFDADKVQILINGIPVNDPESQQVYWSNWTGLASNVKSVQVQRGAGSSLYGSGAFGGSVNIETMGSSVGREIEIRTSVGGYLTDGEVADGKGGKEDYNPLNYNVIARYRSGQLNNGQFNYSLMAERKGGDSYVNGTTYDGWSFSIEAASRIGAHSLNYSLIGAPQKHNQTRKVSDPNLFDALGREYNRNNSEYQENYYFKPQFSVRDEWVISETQTLMANAFITMGKGGGKYLYNDTFDGDYTADTPPTGLMGYQPVDITTDNEVYAQNALWLWLNYGILVDGFVPEVVTYHEDGNPIEYTGYCYMGWDPNTQDYTQPVYVKYGPGYLPNGVSRMYDDSVSLVNGTYDHSWVNDSQNNHVQFGFNSYYENVVSDQLTVTLGGEYRRWMADHFAEAHDFRHYDPLTGDVRTYDEVQRRYDYSSVVSNLSCFIRAKISPVPNVLNFMADVQWANYFSEVEENPIKAFDFRKGEFTGETFYATKTKRDENGDLMFSDSDYDRTFRFISPKAGMNLNLTPEFNVITNFSIAYKEPRTYEWYDRADGPGYNQAIRDDEGNVVELLELKPEKAQTIEWGLGYSGVIFNANVNYYITDYMDKIESVTVRDANLTINAGHARHMGWEISGSASWNNWDATMSATIAQNRWMSMNLDNIFHESAADVVGKVVPFSPEKMASGGVGYTFRNMPMQGRLRVGLDANWWDEYYGNWTNEYNELKYVDGEWDYVKTDAKLPYFFSLNTSAKYDFRLIGKEVSVKLDLNNITDRDENYSAASWGADYGTNGPLKGDRYMYVAPSPRFNMFLTTSVKF